MSLVVEKPGILTTVQDLGRPGYRRLGINPGGVMDRTATRLINIALGNYEGAAVLEMHFPAPAIHFMRSMSIVLGGGDFTPLLDQNEVRNWKVINVNEGSRLTFRGPRLGSRAYLAVAGGFAVDEWLGSSSTNLAAQVGGYGGQALRSGDQLALLDSSAGPRQEILIAPSVIPMYSRFPTVRIIAGAEHELLTTSSRDLLTSRNFTVTSSSDRMGYRLKGEPLELQRREEMISSAVDFGTIQLLPDGQLIVLMAEAQTAGGYPRIGHVVSADLPLLAQLGPGDAVSFHLVDQIAAEMAAVRLERELSFFRAGCRLHTR